MIELQECTWAYIIQKIFNYHWKQVEAYMHLCRSTHYYVLAWPLDWMHNGKKWKKEGENEIYNDHAVYGVQLIWSFKLAMP